MEKSTSFIDFFNEDDYSYIVQEFIDGDNLAQELTLEGVFSEEKVKNLLLSILPVLEFVHKNQVIHRDIKPENIIRRRSDNQLVLVDFGASKVVQNKDLALTGTVIGSAQYCAPEQSFGKANYSSDLYSLGVTCLYLMTGVEPFDLFDTSEGQWTWQDYLPTLPIDNNLAMVLDNLVMQPTNLRYQSSSDVIKFLKMVNSPIYPSYYKKKRNRVSNFEVWFYSLLGILSCIFIIIEGFRN